MTYFASTSMDMPMDMSGTPAVVDPVPLTDAELEAVGAGFLSLGLFLPAWLNPVIPNAFINSILKIFNG